MRQSKSDLTDRAGHRRSRRTRKLRYRPARWAKPLSRKAPVLTADGWVYQSFGQSSKKWIAPSLMSRVFNIHTWVNRLSKAYPITQLAVEHVKFDTQLMENPEISGVWSISAARSTKRNLWEYLLEKFGRKCFYCGAKDTFRLKKSIFFRNLKVAQTAPATSPFRAVRATLKRAIGIPTRLTGEFGKRCTEGTPETQRNPSKTHNPSIRFDGRLSKHSRQPDCRLSMVRVVRRNGTANVPGFRKHITTTQHVCRGYPTKRMQAFICACDPCGGLRASSKLGNVSNYSRRHPDSNALIPVLENADGFQKLRHR